MVRSASPSARASPLTAQISHEMLVLALPAHIRLTGLYELFPNMPPTVAYVSLNRR